MVLDVPVKFGKLTTEVQSLRLVVIPLKVFILPHFRLVASVMLEHISEWLCALCIDLVELANKAEGGLEVILEGHHFSLVLEADHGELGTESHVVEGLLVSQSQLGSVRVELIQREAGHHTDVV